MEKGFCLLIRSMKEKNFFSGYNRFWAERPWDKAEFIIIRFLWNKRKQLFTTQGQWLLAYSFPGYNSQCCSLHSLNWGFGSFRHSWAWEVKGLEPVVGSSPGYSVSDFDYLKGACIFPVHKGGDKLGEKKIYPRQVFLEKSSFCFRARPLLECRYLTFLELDF